MAWAGAGRTIGTRCRDERPATIKLGYFASGVSSLAGRLGFDDRLDGRGNFHLLGRDDHVLGSLGMLFEKFLVTVDEYAIQIDTQIVYLP